MSNAAILWDNIFDDAASFAASEGPTTPVSNLLVPHIGRKWRGVNATSEFILAVYDANQSADTFALVGLGSTFLATGTYRLRLSSVDTAGEAGDRYDSGVIAAAVDPLYGYLIVLRPAVVTGWKYLRWDLAQAGATYIEAGRGVVGTRSQFSHNHSPGLSRAWRHTSRKVLSAGGQTHIDRASPGKAREVEFSLDWIPEGQRWSVHEAIDILNGDHTDVFYFMDPASTNLGRDSLWGLVGEVSPVIQEFNLNDVFRKAYRITERL